MHRDKIKNLMYTLDTAPRLKSDKFWNDVKINLTDVNKIKDALFQLLMCQDAIAEYISNCSTEKLDGYSIDQLREMSGEKVLSEHSDSRAREKSQD
jgi:hypothetical protein